MYVKKQTTLVVATFVLFSQVSWAEDNMSLTMALETVKESNLTLKAARSQMGIFEGRVKQSKNLPNPEIEMGIAEIETGTTNIDGKDGATKEYGINQTVEIWGKRGLRKSVAQSELESVQAEYQILEREIIRQAKEAYWDVSLTHDQVKFARENLQFQQRFLSRVQDRFQSGQVQLSDVSRAKLEVARSSNDLLVAERNRKSAQSKLNQLMGFGLEKQLPEVEHLKKDTLSFNREDLIQIAFENRPEVLAMNASLKGAKSERALARRLLWAPDLNAGYVYQKYEREDGKDSWGGSLGLAFPLWSRYKGERQEASAKLNFMMGLQEERKQAIGFDVHYSFLDFELAKEQIKLFEQSVDEATEAARLAEQRYLEGDADLLVFIQSRRDLVNAIQEYLESLKNYQTNLAHLEQAVGKDITGGNSK